MRDYKIKGWQKWLLRWICKDIVIQSRDHKNNIIEYYTIMYEEMQDEFIEDNKVTLDSFNTECFEDGMK